MRALGLLVSVLLVGLPGCRRLDCFENAALSAAYREGERAATMQNAAAYDAGRGAGLALTAVDGANDGGSEGWSAGWARGYDDSFAAGYDAGWNDGLRDGNLDPSACVQGDADGAWAGDADGAAAGDAEGYASGWPEGWDQGWIDGDATCPAPRARTPRTKDVDAEDLATCRDRGYAVAIDPGPYARGYGHGKEAHLAQARARWDALMAAWRKPQAERGAA